VVENGVAAAPPSPPAPHGPLLHVGHLEPRKNLTVLLAALALLPAERRPPLWLVGAEAGAGAALRAQAAALGLGALVRLLDVVADRDLVGLYAGARAIVVPSVCEGFGLCALEGLAHGRPVLVADRGALPEVVGSCGTVVPAGDPTAWAEAIAATADDDGANDTARRARAALFSWPAAAAKGLAACRSVVATP
jgi:glycosyltransferase involved in cell wall biosynthesis